MRPMSAMDTARATTVSQLPMSVQSNVVLYDGSGLNVDNAAYLSQHDVVYHAPALYGSQGMPIGDGDIGAMLWCPDRLELQLQKSDLWSDPPGGSAAAADWRQISAGTISITTEPGFLQDPSRFEQRLSLSRGVVSIQSDNAHGACQITAFVSASAGVLVVRYRDQSVRSAERRVNVTLDRSGHLFALGETIGILQALSDRRYALLARLAESGARATNQGAHRCSLVLEPSRSTEFTLYVSVAISPRNGDPVAMARSRIDAAMEKGFQQLLAEQRLHWSQFWERSFLRLSGPEDDALPGYLENLWYLTLYQQACCSRGYDAPLANGGLWLAGEDSRQGAGCYVGADLRSMLAGLIASNHLELSVPYVDTLFRLLPELAARTGSQFGMAGARFPAWFNRLGHDLSPPVESRPHQSQESSTRDAAQLLGEGLETGLLVWEAWRHAPDRFFLCERAYPLLRAGAEYAIERCQSTPDLLNNPAVRSMLSTAVRALLWADDEYGFEDEMRPRWEQVARSLVSQPSGYRPPEMLPFGALAPWDSADVFRALINSVNQQPCGLFGDTPDSPDLAFSARLCAGLSGILLTERPYPVEWASNQLLLNGMAREFGGTANGAIQVFSGMPDSWNGAFTLAAPGGFRVSAEAAGGRTRYVAVMSHLGGAFRMYNPWGSSGRARIGQGRNTLSHSASPIIEFMTEPNKSYFIEPYELPLSRAVAVRLGGKANAAPKGCGANRIGIPAAIRSSERAAQNSRLPLNKDFEAVAAVGSRIERARGRPKA